MLKRFVPSGAVHPLVLPAVLAAAIPAAAAAWPYQWIVEFLAAHGGKALVVATFFVPALGVIAGLLAEKAVTGGRCRHPAAGAAVGYLVAAAALAASHYFASRHAAGGSADLSVAEYLEAATATGWRVFGDTPEISGPLVYLGWAVEAGLVLGIAGWLGRAAARRPFCEGCGTWASSHLVRMRVSAPGKEGVGRLREASTSEQLVTLPPRGPDAGGALGQDTLLYTLRGCPRCGGTASLTLDSCTVVHNHRKQPHLLLETLHQDVALSGPDAHAALARIRAMPGAAE